MKKIWRFIKSNLKIVTSFIIGIIISGGTIYAATTIASSSVSYSTTNSLANGATKTDVQGALDELYTKANTWINPKDDYDITPNKNIIINSSEIKLIRNGNLHVIKANNYNEEKDHIQQIFSDISCDFRTGGIICNATDFYCTVTEAGDVYCKDNSDGSDCKLSSDGSHVCKKTISANLTAKMNKYETMLATPAGITIKRNDTYHHLSSNNWSVEKDHVQQIFSDISCTVSSTNVLCNTTDFGCIVYNGGSLNCVSYYPSNSSCYVQSNGTVSCN